MPLKNKVRKKSPIIPTIFSRTMSKVEPLSQEDIFISDCRRISTNFDKCDKCEFRFKCFTKEK